MATQFYTWSLLRSPHSHGQGCGSECADDDGETALHPASGNGHTEIASHASWRGQMLAQRTMMATQPYDQASDTGHLRPSVLIERGADISARTMMARDGLYSQQLLLVNFELRHIPIGSKQIRVRLCALQDSFTLGTDNGRTEIKPRSHRQRG
jgi:hypothetical protein